MAKKTRNSSHTVCIEPGRIVYGAAAISGVSIPFPPGSVSLGHDFYHCLLQADRIVPSVIPILKYGVELTEIGVGYRMLRAVSETYPTCVDAMLTVDSISAVKA